MAVFDLLSYANCRSVATGPLLACRSARKRRKTKGLQCVDYQRVVKRCSNSLQKVAF